MNFSKLFIFSSIFFFNISFSGEWGDILPSKLPKPPEIKVEIDFPAKQPVRPKCIYDPSIRQLISSSSHNHRLEVEVKLQPKPVITGMSTIASYVSQAMFRMGYINELTAIDPKAGYEEQLKFTHEIKQTTNAVTKALNEKYAAMSTRDIVRQGTSFLVEGWLTGKAITTLGSLSKNAAMLSRIAAGNIKNIVRSSEALEPIAVGVGKVEELPSKAGMLFNEIEEQAGKVSTVESQLGKAVEQEAKQLAAQATECPASCPKQYENLKNALKAEEFTSIIDVTEHGLQRLIERGFEAEEVLNLVTIPDFIKVQVMVLKFLLNKLRLTNIM
jgi:stage V sporulation protein SpoVS